MLPVRFPFCAVCGQQPLKLALILAAINPAIGGVLVTGPRGSAKSPLARGLADILPGESHDFVTLPLAASEEMLVGTMDLQQVLSNQQVAFNPGLLAKAHNGVLYVDEVNLLPDSLVDLLLDVAASGVNCVERDGISHSHESRFLLLGTMNQDEGELRGQLLDRFGFSVMLDNQYSIEQRIEIVKLRDAFDTDPNSFVAQYDNAQQQLKQTISNARSLLSKVQCDDGLRKMIAERCFAANVDGLRADIVWFKAATAHAVWHGRVEVTEQDILAVEELVLSHRRKNTVEPPSPQEQQPPPNNKNGFTRPSPKQAASKKASGEWGAMVPVQQKTADTLNLSLNTASTKLGLNKPEPNRQGDSQQRKIDTKQADWFATLVNAFGQWPPKNLRFKKTIQKSPVLNMVLLDTSASTLKQQQFGKAKAVVMQIAEQAYLLRQQICVFGFGNQQVSMLMAKQKAPKQIKQWLDDITAAGGTPLKDMLTRAVNYQQNLLKTMTIKTWLITDGRTSQDLQGISLLGEVVLVDVEDSPVKRGKGPDIARQLGCDYVSLSA